MSDFLDLINYASHRPELVKSLAGQLGLSQQQTDQASQMLMAAIGGGLLNNINNGGLEGLLSALNRGNHQTLLNRTKTPGDNLFSVIQEGNQILGHILGNKNISRKVAETVEQKTDVEAAILKTMLPIIAAAVMGLLAQAKKKQGENRFSSSLTHMLDMDQDGTPGDDIIRLVGSLK